MLRFPVRWLLIQLQSLRTSQGRQPNTMHTPQTLHHANTLSKKQPFDKGSMNALACQHGSVHAHVCFLCNSQRQDGPRSHGPSQLRPSPLSGFPPPSPSVRLAVAFCCSGISVCWNLTVPWNLCCLSGLLHYCLLSTACVVCSLSHVRVVPDPRQSGGQLPVCICLSVRIGQKACPLHCLLLDLSIVTDS